ncbi:o-succinylbenzoate--CoA ligase [Vibrio sp. 10N.261.46.E12]|uniref:o-succinylbenzoate--CoA ligase n=1 Tax=unclassified Vibrio TaxID=2614977 RepID=UPI000977C92F|nr:MULTISPECIES: o-succinylbenzoate--CoA ligase [unclassified Vibrio]OMO35267.1 o-succinylbenzoate--CoA ligase [Vibrio sp. 10N.261.45.E1]PMJ24461.1 o-succinylbenzoate--CoA ligase [Vibrio sp. 10N.286.45.B6]PML85747.1 o-succinylbenzoate--CoA ligase [Vibrio sp. 10N.261.49.E11]PMM65818.1 o-succinylbenzoate--CoA ligase [Vibrio sp. 10N.261.46.F12]PMM79438.1 o-succinylbenzoate--CoA ligase [Vibrio sp. 10N.261.46.E8]
MMRPQSNHHPLWVQWAQQNPLQPALVTTHRTYTWQQVTVLVSEYQQLLSHQGLSEGDVLTIVGKNQAEVIPVYLAALNLGVVCAFTMPQPAARLTQKLESLYVSSDSCYLWLLESGGIDLSEVAAPNTQLLTLPCLNDLDGNEKPIATSEPSCFSYQNLASIVFTSGSTGNPKAVAHTLDQHLYSATGLLEVFRYQQGDTWLLSLPMYHVSGLAIVHRWLAAGGCIKIGSGQLELDIVGCSHASLVATQLHRLLKSKQGLTLTHVLLGGSHIPEALGLEAQQMGIETWLGYGMTEAASTVTAKLVDASSTAGFILNHRQLKIEEQRIFIGGETLASGYYYQGKLTPLVDKNGWFDSKDLGEWVGEQVSIIGRADNQFISGGENIHCEEIERALNQLSEVNQAFIVPIEDDEFGFRPIAIVDCVDLPTKEWFAEQLTGRLERFKFPVEYYQMPKQEQQSIKVSRAGLAAWLSQHRNSK